MNKGIAVAGTLLVDKLNVIDRYPNSGELTQIKSVSRAVGGCVPNVGIDLKRIDKDLRVIAVGAIGDDEDGLFIRETLSENALDVSGLTSYEEKTSFTDVMSISGGERTFFTYAGASALFGRNDVDLDALNIDLLHLGYFLLLDKVDKGDGLEILKKAKEKGVKTSIDLVSENSDRYSLVEPCLPYTDNLIVNEIEAGHLAGILPERQNLRKIAETLKLKGVKERVIIHMPELGVCLSDNGYTEIPSFELPKGYIKGATGAGDAFCAGSLYGIYKGYSDSEVLEFSSMCAVMSLRCADATSGVVSENEIKGFCSKFNRKK